MRPGNQAAAIPSEHAASQDPNLFSQGHTGAALVARESRWFNFQETWCAAIKPIRIKLHKLIIK